jgi:hypothetical protein
MLNAKYYQRVESENNTWESPDALYRDVANETRASTFTRSTQHGWLVNALKAES